METIKPKQKEPNPPGKSQEVAEYTNSSNVH